MTRSSAVHIDVMFKLLEDWDLRISKKKSRIMVMTRGNSIGRGGSRLKGLPLELVGSFKHLGSYVIKKKTFVTHY